MKACFILPFILLAFSGRTQTTFHKVSSAATGRFEHIAMAAAADGDALIACSYATGTTSNLSVHRVSATGNTVWVKAVQSMYAPIVMAAMPDSGAVILLVDTTITLNRIEILKLNKTGTIQWGRSFYANIAALIHLPTIITDADGNIYLAYASTDSAMLKKMSGSGNLLWEKSFNNTNTSLISPTAIVFYGAAIYIGGYDANAYLPFLIKTDTTGNILWQKVGVGEVGAGTNLMPVGSNSLIVSTQGASSGTRVALIDAGGSLRWARKLSLSNTRMVRISANAIGFIAEEAGIIRAVILDTLGIVKSSKSYRDSLATYKYAISAIPDNGFWISSINGNKIWLMKADATGNSGCFTLTDTITPQNVSLSPNNFNLTADAAGPTALANVTLTPQTITMSDSVLCGVLRINSVAGAAAEVYPNPVLDKLIIRQRASLSRFTVYNSEGKKVVSGTLDKPETSINVSEWNKGLYLIHIEESTRMGTSYKVIRQ